MSFDARQAAGEASQSLIMNDTSDAWTFDADSLVRLCLGLAPEVFDALLRSVEAAEGCGEWSGMFSVLGSVVHLESTTRLHTSPVDGQRLRQLQWDWELGMAWRQARISAVPLLPDVRNWVDSDEHRALIEAVPVFAQRALAERWSDERRSRAFGAFVEKMQSFRLRPTLTRDATNEFREAGSVSHEDAEPGEAEKANDADRIEARLLELGCRGIDPYSYAVAAGPSADTLSEFAYRMDGCPPIESDLLSRRIVHALLVAETGAFLQDLLPVGFGRGTRGERWRFVRASAARPRDRDYARQADVKWSVEKRDRMARELERSRILWYLVLQLLALGLAGSVGWSWAGIPGAVLGGLIGTAFVDHWLSQRAEHRDQQTRLADKMQLAVIAANYDENPWSLILRAMSRAANAGAAWPVAAWRIAEAERHAERQRSRGRGHTTAGEPIT